MNDFTRRLSSKIFDPAATPASTISIKVNRRALRSVVDRGLKKTNWIERIIPISICRWVSVEATEHGTNDSVFFVPEHPNIDQSHERTLPAQYIKVKPSDHLDVVRIGDNFEVSFVGMSIAPMDVVGFNELLLCSLTREGNSTLEQETKSKLLASPSSSLDSEDTESWESAQQQATDAQTKADIATASAAGIATDKPAYMAAGKVTDDAARTLADAAATTVTDSTPNNSADNTVETDPVKLKELSVSEIKANKELELLSELPTALTIQPQDIPFLHYDPEVDGHDTGSAPDSFVPIPGSKRVYVQRRGDKTDMNDVAIRFTVMEVDKLSEEQLIAIKSLDEIGKSVGKAAATVPYLKFISWILKFANFLGRSALKKVAEPEHVLSKDIVFLLADAEERDANISENSISRSLSANTRREEYGNYLRYGYYFFLNTTVDAKLYAQTGASSQSVPLLLRRSGYKPRFALRNEREFFPLTGVSYVAVKVTRGCSQLDLEQRIQMKKRHRTRLVKLLKKYTGKLEDAVD